MKLLMISGDRSILQRKQGAFWYTLQELRKHWERIDIICPRVPRPKSNGTGKVRAGESCLLEGSVHFHPGPRCMFCQPWWIARKGKEIVESFGHDVMTVHEYPPFYNGLGASWLAKRISLPYALEVHHLVGVPKPASLQEAIGRHMSRRYLRYDARRAKAVRAVNMTVKDQLVGWGIPEEKIQVIPSFYLDRATFNAVKQPPVIYDVVFCARLVRNKGLRELIHAIHTLPNIRLLVIGDGPERLPCEKLAHSLNIEGRVAFVGWLPTMEAVLDAMKSARIFVMNSKSEGGPRSALEAMANGMPVITTSVGVMPEVISESVNGLFTTGQPDDLAQKIQLLLQDKSLCEKMSKEARKILDRFERTKLIKEYADFLKSLVQPGSTS